jgi:hypothetical protein
MGLASCASLLSLNPAKHVKVTRVRCCDPLKRRCRLVRAGDVNGGVTVAHRPLQTKSLGDRLPHRRAGMRTCSRPARHSSTASICERAQYGEGSVGDAERVEVGNETEVDANAQIRSEVSFASYDTLWHLLHRVAAYLPGTDQMMALKHFGGTSRASVPNARSCC